MPPRPRTQANEAAEERYRQKYKQVLVRFTPAEMRAIEDALEQGESAAAFLKAHGLKAAQRAAARK